MTRELPVNRFHSKSFYVLRDIIIYHLTFLWFLFNVVFLTTIFPPIIVRIAQVTSGISGDACLQKLPDTQRWVGDRDLITVNEKYFLLLSAWGEIMASLLPAVTHMQKLSMPSIW
jgi:hypothetical protein